MNFDLLIKLVFHGSIVANQAGFSPIWNSTTLYDRALSPSTFCSIFVMYLLSSVFCLQPIRGSGKDNACPGQSSLCQVRLADASDGTPSEPRPSKVLPRGIGECSSEFFPIVGTEDLPLTEMSGRQAGRQAEGGLPNQIPGRWCGLPWSDYDVPNSVRSLGRSG